MNSKIKYPFLLILAISCFPFKSNAFFLSDTLIICHGESVQLSTTPNQISYNWSPNEHIDNNTIFNPIVSPDETTTYYVTIQPVPNVNLVYNGDFSYGNVGFESEYEYTTVSTFVQGYYAIFTSPTQFNAGFGDCVDHSNSSDGLMFVADGATVLGENVWCQTFDVIPGRTYDFSAWITNIHPTAPSLLQFSINGVLLGQLLEVDEELCQWEEFSEEWYSGNNTSATICITNQNVIAFGNDFAIDDITFVLADDTYIDTFTVIVLENAETQIDTTICANHSVIFDGVEIPADTVAVFNYSAWNGCDSLVYLTVNAIDTSYTETRIDTLCPGDTIYYQNIPITKDTAICDIFTNYLGCDSSICFVAYFLSEATISANLEEPFCSGEDNGSISVSPFAGLPPYQFIWNSGEETSFIDDVTAGSYSVTVTDAKGCVAEKFIDLNEPLSLALDFLVEEPSCFGESDAQITILGSGGTPEYLYVFDNESLIEDTIVENIPGGNYSILMEDKNGCILDTFILVDQPNPILIALPNDTSLQLGCYLDLDVQITADLPYQIQWVPLIGIDCNNCENPRVTPLEDVTYQATVLDTAGCESIDYVDISIIKNYEVFIPNAFSPNNDGTNDFFEIYVGKDVEKVISFLVFNRWGATVFQKENLAANDPECKWDGSFNTEPFAPGVFVYLIEIKFIDGHEKIFSGDVSIMK